MEEVVSIAREGPVVSVTLNRPQRRNAINRAMIEGLREAFAGAAQAPECRCLVLRGAGGNFSAGRDLSGQAPARSLPDFLDRDAAWTDIFRRLGALAKPSVAVVEGYAVAGGCTLAMACDFVVAAPGAQFGALEMRHDFPASINTPLVAKLTAPRIGLELVMTGELFSAPRLYEVGLVNRVAPDDDSVEAEAGAFVERLCGLDPDAVAMTKQLYRAALNAPLANALDMGMYANALLAASGRIGEAEKRFGKRR